MPFGVGRKREAKSLYWLTFTGNLLSEVTRLVKSSTIFQELFHSAKTLHYFLGRWKKLIIRWFSQGTDIEQSLFSSSSFALKSSRAKQSLAWRFFVPFRESSLMHLAQETHPSPTNVFITCELWNSSNKNSHWRFGCHEKPLWKFSVSLDEAETTGLKGYCYWCNVIYLCAPEHLKRRSIWDSYHWLSTWQDTQPMISLPNRIYASCVNILFLHVCTFKID